eukprot:Nk52_evm11s268 gene=Nk52_evmTU11s268
MTHDASVLVHVGIGAVLGAGGVLLMQHYGALCHEPVGQEQECFLKLNETIEELKRIIEAKNDLQNSLMEASQETMSTTDTEKMTSSQLESKKEELSENATRTLQYVDDMRPNIKDANHAKELLNVLKRQNIKNPRKCEILWRLARAYYDLGEKMKKDRVEHRKLISNAFDITKNAVSLDENNFAAHKWYAIISCALVEFGGTKEKINNGYVFKKHIDRAIELNPSDASCHHLLGRWCFEVSQLSWLERNALSLMFATPPTATIDDALRYFLKAEELNPGFWSTNTLMIAKCLFALNRKGEGIEWINRILPMSILNEEDENVHSEAAELLKKHA